MDQLKPGYDYSENHFDFFEEIPHERAISLAEYEFFWDVYDELAPFGSEEAYIAFCELRGWLSSNPDKPILDCFKWILNSWNLDLEEFNDSILEQNYILNMVYDLDFEDDLLVLDCTIISTGFGLLIIYGKIDDEVKDIIHLAILRQMNSYVLDAYLGADEIGKYRRYMYLQKLLDILREA